MNVKEKMSVGSISECGMYNISDPTGQDIQTDDAFWFHVSSDFNTGDLRFWCEGYLKNWRNESVFEGVLCHLEHRYEVVGPLKLFE